MPNFNPGIIDAVFFDFEGTVVDFQWQLDAAVDETLTALAQAGIPRSAYGTAPGYAAIYNHSASLCSQEITAETPNLIREVVDPIYDRFDRDALTRWQLFPDTKAVLSALAQNHYRLGMISNVGKIALSTALKRLHIDTYFSVVISRNEMSRIKPDAEGLLTAARQLDIPSSRVLFVGDSRNDVAAAHAAGMTACYLAGGEDLPEQLSSFSPDLMIDSLSQLLPLLASP